VNLCEEISDLPAECLRFELLGASTLVLHVPGECSWCAHVGLVARRLRERRC
jgi:hypothetical protein